MGGGVCKRANMKAAAARCNAFWPVSYFPMPDGSARTALLNSAALRSQALLFFETLGTPHDSLSREEYNFIHRRIIAVLAPDLSDEEAEDAADGDWLDDLGIDDEEKATEGAQGRHIVDLMSLEKFLDALCMCAATSMPQPILTMC